MKQVLVIILILVLVYFVFFTNYEGFAGALPSGASCKSNLECSSETCLSTGPGSAENGQHTFGRFCV